MSNLHLSTLVVDGGDPSICQYLFNGDKASPLRHHLGARLPRPMLLRVHETFAGNPLYALELARALDRMDAAPAPGLPLPVPAGLDALIGDRVRSQSAEVRILVAGTAAAWRFTDLGIPRWPGPRLGATWPGPSTRGSWPRWPPGRPRSRWSSHGWPSTVPTRAPTPSAPTASTGSRRRSAGPATRKVPSPRPAPRWTPPRSGRHARSVRSGSPKACSSNPAAATIRSALAYYDTSPFRFDRARTRLIAGRILRRARARRTARELMSSAIGDFTSFGAVAWAARGASELARMTVRPTAPAHLTETEQRIADLAATGMTNRAIAERLFVATKTIEANLARIYRKLDIRTRAELGARIGRPL